MRHENVRDRSRKNQQEPNFFTNETVEVSWMYADEVLQRCKTKDLNLAPPQWCMLKEI